MVECSGKSKPNAALNNLLGDMTVDVTYPLKAYHPIGVSK